ncbi:MAG: hypothetical protein AAGB31_16395, partial [Bdellovibrio sp.]
KKRTQKIFLDYLRNGFGSTAIAPYSLRSKKRPTVAVPLSWDELRRMKVLKKFDLEDVLRRLATQKRDPWEKFYQLKQKVSLLEKKSQFKKNRRVYGQKVFEIR